MKMQCHLVIVYVTLYVVVGERSSQHVQPRGFRERFGVAANNTSSSSSRSSQPAVKLRREIAPMTSGMSVLTCFECHYGINGDREHGHEVCLDEFRDTDQRHRAVVQVNCTKGSCEKSWLYLGENELSITRRCNPDCHEQGEEGSDYITRCCQGPLCNGTPGPPNMDRYIKCFCLLLSLAGTLTELLQTWGPGDLN